SDLEREKKGGWRLLYVFSPRTMDGSWIIGRQSRQTMERKKERHRERDQGVMLFLAFAIICFIPLCFPCLHVGIGNDYRPMDERKETAGMRLLLRGMALACVWAWTIG